ncbi:MAG TPA: biopolymer transporter ExbD [Caulobacteraceae bacterium]|nr:biopolymer transporter ExbD [Caulobacteraceae bacterium]
MGAKLSGGGGNKYTVESNADINVTPFVDIMLVLLIIFMVSIPMATVSIKLDMPPAVPPPPGQKPKPPVFVSIQESGELYIGRGEEAPVKTSIDTLAGDLAGRLAVPNPQDEQVFVRADPDVEYASFMEVLNEMQDKGFYKIGLINEDIT